MTPKKRLSTTAFIRIIIRITRLVYDVVPYLIISQAVLVVLYSLSPFLNRYVTGRIFDSIIESVGISTEITSSILTLVAIYIGLTFLANIIEHSKYVVDVNIREHVRHFVEKMLIAKFASLDIEYHENPKMNDLIQRSQQSVHRPIGFYFTLIEIFAGLVGVSASFYLLFDLNPYILLILAICVLPEAINNAIFGQKVWNLFREKSADVRDFNMTKRHLISESSLKEVRIFGLQKYLFDRAFAAFERYYSNWLVLRNRRELINLTFGLFSNIGFAITFYMLVSYTFNQTITVGLLTFYIGTATSFSSSINRIFKSFTVLYEEGLYVADVFEVMDLPQIIVSGDHVLASHAAAPEIVFNNVTFVYPGTDKKVLDQVNLKISSGEHIAFVGENGAGKTTLIKLLMRFYDVTSGEIFVDGVNIKDLDTDSWYSKVASLFQDYNFYHFTAWDNIGVGQIGDKENFDKVVFSAKKSGAHDFIESYENKYNQVLNKVFSGGINPSEGQKQRIALARAFFKDSSVLVMDEPTSAIDPKAEYEIFQELLSFAKNKTVIMISHRFSTVRNADRIVVLDDGKIVEEGSHESLMKIENGQYQHAFNLQKRGYE